MPQCIVPDCKNLYLINKNITHHSFPRNNDLGNVWLKWLATLGSTSLLELPYNFLRNKYLICGDHFETSCFQTPQRKKFNRGAVPSRLFKEVLNDGTLLSAVEIKPSLPSHISQVTSTFGTSNMDGIVQVKSEIIKDETEEKPLNFAVVDESSNYMDTYIKEELEEKKIEIDEDVPFESKPLINNLTSEQIESKKKNIKVTLFECPKCDYSTTRLRLFWSHLRTHPKEKNLKCAFCDYSATYNAQLKIHLRVHTGERPHACPYCDYKATQTSSLQYHIFGHTGEKPFKCEICGSAFRNRHGYNTHKRIHTDERPYKCFECGYATRNSDCLRSHMRKHSIKNLLYCNDCSFTTIYKSALVKHVMIHRSEKRYKCTLCEFGTNWRVNLRNHGRIHLIAETKKEMMPELVQSKKRVLKSDKFTFKFRF